MPERIADLVQYKNLKPAQIVIFLHTHSDLAFTPEEIAKELECDVATIYRKLKNLCGSKKILKVYKPNSKNITTLYCINTEINLAKLSLEWK